MERFRIEDAFRFGWDVMAANLGFFVLIVLIFWVASGIPSALQSWFYDVYPLVTIFGIAEFAVGIFINMASVRIGLKFCDGMPGEYSDLYAAYPAFWRFLAGMVLYVLLVVAGLILLIVPGIYWAIKYFFVPYLILDRGMGPLEAFTESGRITHGQKWYLLLFWLAIAGANLLGALLCLIGLFATIPITLVATAYVYRRLLSTAGTEAQAPGPGAPTGPQGGPGQGEPVEGPGGAPGSREGPPPPTPPFP